MNERERVYEGIYERRFSVYEGEKSARGRKHLLRRGPLLWWLLGERHICFGLARVRVMEWIK